MLCYAFQSAVGAAGGAVLLFQMSFLRQTLSGLQSSPTNMWRKHDMGPVAGGRSPDEQQQQQRQQQRIG